MIQVRSVSVSLHIKNIGQDQDVIEQLSFILQVGTFGTTAVMSASGGSDTKNACTKICPHTKLSAVEKYPQNSRRKQQLWLIIYPRTYGWRRSRSCYNEIAIFPLSRPCAALAPRPSHRPGCLALKRDEVNLTKRWYKMFSSISGFEPAAAAVATESMVVEYRMRMGSLSLFKWWWFVGRTPVWLVGICAWQWIFLARQTYRMSQHVYDIRTCNCANIGVDLILRQIDSL